MLLNNHKGHLQDWITQIWVKATGRRFNPIESPWLKGPIGDTDEIGDKFIYNLAAEQQLEIQKNIPGSGLLQSINELELTVEEKQRLHPKIADFYERTSAYNFEIWSEWQGIFKPFGWLLAVIFSRRLKQLNLPLSALDSAKGLNSNIICLADKNGKVKWTVWHRILKGTQRVIYSGVYTTCTLPGSNTKFLKVVFPLPNGNAMVIMRREILQNGSLLLTSDGKRYGDNGFYFTLTNHKGSHWAKFVPAMHEWINVYVDEENILRADHQLKFYSFYFLKLHYKMTEKQEPLF